jgi:hypothetical protein
LRFRRDGFSVESAIVKGRPLPDWYEDEPTLLPGDEFYLEEFWILHTTRPSSGGAFGRIPFPEIERRGEIRHGMDEDAFRLFASVICSMDEGFLEWMSEEYKRNMAKAKHERPRMNGPRS